MTEQAVLVLKFPFGSSFGGGEKHTFDVVDALTKLGFSFSLWSNDPVLLDGFAQRNLPNKKCWAPPEPVTGWSAALFIPLGLVFSILYTARLLAFRIKHRRPVFYCLSLSEKIALTLPARLLGYRVVWVEHIVPGRWLRLNPFRPWLRLVSRLAVIVALSHAVASELHRLGFAEQATTVVYPGIDIHRYTLGKHWPRHAGRFHLGIVARLHQEKGQDIAIQAMAKIREFIPFATLSVVGQGDELPALRWLTRKLGLEQAVHFVGVQTQIERWLHEFDVLLMPSQVEESFGIILVEAMASGVPVVASRRGGVPEIITHAETGLLLPNGSSDEIVQAVMYLYNNRPRASEMIRAGREMVEQRFPIDTMIVRFSQLLRR